jgi:hypothetical protein
MRISSLLFAAALVAGASITFGHGVQVQITYNPDTDKIETREVVHTDARPTSISDLKRVYIMPLLATIGGAGDGWYTRPDDSRNAFNLPNFPSGPGLNFQYDDVSQLLGTGWAFSGSATLPNLQGTNFGYSIVDGLKSWNGSSFIDPGTEQMQVMRGDGTAAPAASAVTSDAGPFGSVALGAVNTLSGNPHSSMSFRLLGDGVNGSVGGVADGDDGIYLLSLQITSTATGVGPSDTFHYVVHKNAPLNDAIAAANSLGFAPGLIQVVPEPGALSLLALAGLVLKRRR